MARYELRADESVLLEPARVVRRGGRLGGSDDLVLTNVHLIIVDRGALGKSDVEYLRLDSLKVLDKRPQVLVTKSRDGRAQLEAFFIDRHEVFQFQSGGRRTAVRWADAISAAAMGRAADVQVRANMAVPGTELVVETVRDTVAQAAKSLFTKRAR